MNKLAPVLLLSPLMAVSANQPTSSFLQLYASELRVLYIDTSSINRYKDGTFTVTVVNVYTDRARELGLVASNVAKSSGVAKVDCIDRTFEVLTDTNEDGRGKAVGPTGDAGTGGRIRENYVVGLLASLICKVPKGAQRS